MASLFKRLYETAKDATLNKPFFDTRFKSIDSRIDPLEQVVITWQDAVRQVSDRVLRVSEQVVGDLRDKLIRLTDLEWLTATSGTPLQLAIDADRSLIIDADDRALFSPGPWSVISRLADFEQFAVVRTLAYDRVGGQWDFAVHAIFGGVESDEFTDWQIASIAGSTLAQMAMLQETRAHSSATLTARDTVLEAADEVAENTQTAVQAKQVILDKLIVSPTAPVGKPVGTIWIKPQP